jgi:tetratricopeptide (TPR) repeat protein
VHLRRAIDINPQNAEAHRNLSVALGLQGRVDEATRAARAAVRIQPESAEARKQLDLLLRAELQHRALMADPPVVPFVPDLPVLPVLPVPPDLPFPPYSLMTASQAGH